MKGLLAIRVCTVAMSAGLVFAASVSVAEAGWRYRRATTNYVSTVSYASCDCPCGYAPSGGAVVAVAPQEYTARYGSYDATVDPTARTVDMGAILRFYDCHRSDSLIGIDDPTTRSGE